jgi:glycosyltransferase involved in cell wall biosynthesis
MIEAMARGLPCIGSSVGGIPELLAPEDLVPPGDPNALAAKIREVVTAPGRMERMSARNLTKAREYHEGALRQRRIAFLKHLRDETEKWVSSREQ